MGGTALSVASFLYIGSTGRWMDRWGAISPLLSFLGPFFERIWPSLLNFSAAFPALLALLALLALTAWACLLVDLPA